MSRPSSQPNLSSTHDSLKKDISDAYVESRCPTLVDQDKVILSATRKYLLLSIFCLSQFLDAVNVSALFSAIPTLESALSITPSQSTWLVSAWQLTFASFLLMSGKISDVYNPKSTFIIGISILGIVSLGMGFVHDKIALFILRAIGGIFGSMTIPSSLSLIVQVFPEPKEQSRAIGIFGGLAAIGNVLGLVIGAIFIEYASWRWVFWFATVLAIPVALIGAFFIPRQQTDAQFDGVSKLRRLDIPGVSALTAAIVLFIYALTTASTAGWGSANILVPLLISVVVVIGFFFWEARLPAQFAAIPSATWFIPSFSVLFGGALLPFFWWTNVFTIFTTLWQGVYQWTAMNSAIHMLPIGISALILSFTGSLSRFIGPKKLILTGQTFMLVSTILLAFADRQNRYWSHAFPAFIIGSAGAMLTFTHTNIAILRIAPPSMTGTVGAIFNGALQLGSAVGLAVVTSIQTSVDGEDVNSFNGRRAAFWFTLAIVAVEIIATLVFLRTPSSAGSDEPSVSETSLDNPKIIDSEQGLGTNREVQ